MNLTQMVGPIVPTVLCWAVLLLTVTSLLVSFYFTNITAFARNTREGRKATSGSELPEQRY